MQAACCVCNRRNTADLRDYALPEYPAALEFNAGGAALDEWYASFAAPISGQYTINEDELVNGKPTYTGRSFIADGQQATWTFAFNPDGFGFQSWCLTSFQYGLRVGSSQFLAAACVLTSLIGEIPPKESQFWFPLIEGLTYQDVAQLANASLVPVDLDQSGAARSETGLSAAEIAAIVIGSVVCVAMLALYIVRTRRHRYNKLTAVSFT